jgi:hypothetical protein
LCARQPPPSAVRLAAAICINGCYIKTLYGRCLNTEAAKDFVMALERGSCSALAALLAIALLVVADFRADFLAIEFSPPVLSVN